MTKKKHDLESPEELSLEKLCEAVTSLTIPYEDVAEFIENRTYELCAGDNCNEATNLLIQVTSFFEAMQTKNEENCRDLADVYILIGEVNQYVGHFKDSLDWFKKAAVVFDRYAVPYHNLATSYLELGDMQNAIKSLEQEIQLEPGNYYSWLRLADLYEQQGALDKEEECLKQLLVRNPENIQALHKLIVYYEKQQPDGDVELLRKRLLGIRKTYNEMELVIRVYHLCRENLLSETLDYLAAKIKENPSATIFYLLKAYIYGELHQYSHKRKELTEFKQHCHGKKEFMKNKLEEFEHVFGKKAVVRLGKILVVSNPNVKVG